MWHILQLIIALAGIAAGAYLWHLGGQGQKWARAYALPVMLTLVKMIMNIPHFYIWELLYAPALMGLIALFSYGIKAPPHKFWVWVFGQGEDGNYPPVEIATRATCGFFWSLAGIIFVLGGGSVLMQILYTIAATVGNGLIYIYVKDVEINEPATGALVSCSLFV